jgi:Cu-Zn family superoxide dismutase
MRAALVVAAFVITTGCGVTVRNSTADPDSAASPDTAILVDFEERIDRYMDLRNQAADEVIDAEVTDDPARLRAREEALAARIRTLRAKAKHGDIFTPAIRTQFRLLLAPELKGEQGRDIRDILQDDAPTPGAVPIGVNARYPAGEPYPTTPASVLLILPSLPPGLEYRVIGKDLILLDQPADVILDFIRNAVPSESVVTARAELKSPSGVALGSVFLRETANGVLLRTSVRGVPPGTHGFHIHDVGKCDAPTFESAGGHFSPDERVHGFFAKDGPHAGDLPNLHVRSDGQLSVDLFVSGLSLARGSGTLLDEDGSALVIHAGEDDYRTEPAGSAGDRIACGAVVR